MVNPKLLIYMEVVPISLNNIWKFKTIIINENNNNDNIESSIPVVERTF